MPTAMGTFPRVLQADQICRVNIFDIALGSSVSVFETSSLLLEAPNWTRDGRSLILNGDGLVWRLDLDTFELSRIEYVGLPAVNNDHVLAADREHVFFSARDYHLYEGSVHGGKVRRVSLDHSPTRMHFLHGVSPDGSTLAYIGIEADDANRAAANIFTLDIAGGAENQITFGNRPSDGSEYSSDGWLYFNTELFSAKAGHAQIARIRPDGSELEQLTEDDRVNWFPHPSPDNERIVYLSYEPGTVGHPADEKVELRLVDGVNFRRFQTVATLHGGQGTINVNSWAPDSARFAFVDYPMAPRDVPSR